MTTHILFHAKSINPFRPCMDGLFAAYAATLAIPTAKLVPAMYGLQPEIDDAENLMEIKALGESAQTEITEAIHLACWRSTTRIVLGDEVAFVECETQREFQAYSDIGHALLKRHPTAQYAVVQTGRGWALRSEDNRADVARIAKALGGGGHRNAAGCKAELPPSSWFDIRNWWRIEQ